MKVLYLNLGGDLIGAPEFLRAENYDVIEVSSFRGALKLIEGYGLDAVLVDNNKTKKPGHFHLLRTRADADS